MEVIDNVILFYELIGGVENQDSKVSVLYGEIGDSDSILYKDEDVFESSSIDHCLGFAFSYEVDCFVDSDLFVVYSMVDEDGVSVGGVVYCVLDF